MTDSSSPDGPSTPTGGIRDAPALQLDVSGLECPLPVLEASKALRGLEPGQRLHVTATDPQSPADFEALCASAGHTLRAMTAEAGVFRFDIVKGQTRARR